LGFVEYEEDVGFDLEPSFSAGEEISGEGDDEFFDCEGVRD